MKKDYALYWAAFKMLLKKDGKFLFLTFSESGINYLDLPGGRADFNEGEVPLEKILKREVKEETGDKIRYILGGPLFQYRRYSSHKRVYNLVTVYGAKYLSGPIKLSFEHNKYEWLDPRQYKFKEKEFYAKEEYEAFQKYFKNNKI